MQDFGLTREARTALKAKQNNQCLVCLRSFDEVVAHVDHDHACCPTRPTCGECIRGLLCGMCNHALGLLKDDVERFQRAISYLERKKDV